MTKAEKCARMRAGKARNREALGAVATVCAGWAVFGGPLFGRHRVELRCREDAPHALALFVDKKLTCSKTPRGVRSLIARRISGKIFV